jgi:hypothetical protein
VPTDPVSAPISVDDGPAPSARPEPVATP